MDEGLGVCDCCGKPARWVAVVKACSEHKEMYKSRLSATVKQGEEQGHSEPIVTADSTRACEECEKKGWKNCPKCPIYGKLFDAREA